MDDESSCHISHSQSSNLQKLSLKDLREITNDFSDERLLGQGGFGRVYKGVQQNGDIIAVKKLTWSMTGIQDKQYDNEARHLMRLKHPNIVQLLGYCSETEKELVLHNGKYVYAEKSERLLCLEYLSKGSLREHLSDESSGLDWETRYKIIKGICCGLHYLHEEWESTPIIHRDLKPANILVDDNMVPKIADFGLSRLFGEEQTRTCTRSCDGTPGYMAPEYINRGIITKKLDIFSLGVIIIEIMTGHRDYPDETQASSELFIELVLKNWRDRMEKALGYTPRKTQCQQIRRCIQIGLQCVTLDRTKRPTTGQIMKMLHGSEAVDCSNERQIPEELRQEINQAGTAGKADEGLPTNETKGKNTRFQLRFLNKLKRPIYCHHNILSEIDTPIEIGIFDYDAMIIDGPRSEVKVEILALEGDFPYNPLNSWTAFEFNKHIAHSWDRKGNVLVGEGTTACLRDGKCYLGQIQFREDSSWSRGARFIIGARVYNGEATRFRIQEAVMDPVFVQDGSLCLSLFPQPEQIELSQKYPGPSSSFDDYYSMHNQGAGAVGVQAVSRNVNGAAPEFNIPHWWSQLKVHGLRPSMPVDDMVNHLSNCISEQITSGIPELASNEVPTKETLEEIAQYLLGDVQGPPVSASDESSLMARVDPLRCLIQKDAGMSGLGMTGA